MAYNSLLGYAKDGVAEVVALGPRDAIKNWAFGFYRNLKFYSPTTGELKTWLEANAVKMPLTGTWVFNETLSNPSFLSQTAHNVSIQANSNSQDITAMRFELRNDTGAMEISYVVPGGNSFSAYHETWRNAAYRVITFTEPVQYQGNEEFVRWFVDNVTPPSIIEKGTYVFKDGLSSGPWKKGSSVTQRIFAKSNNTDVSSITLLVGAEKTLDGLGGFNIEKISYDLNVGGMTKTTQVYFGYVWTSAAYKTIEITEDCIVDEQFKKWFDYYTTKQ